MKNTKQTQVGNFEKLVSFTNAQGAVYNPGKASIKSAALQTLLTQAQGAIQAAYVSRTAYVNAVNAREQLIKTVPGLATRIIGALQGSGVSDELMRDCKAIKRRFHRSAIRAEKLPASANVPGPVENGESVHRSTSQADIASMIANLQQLVVMASSDPLFKPNEADLHVTALNAFIANLQDKNKAVSIAKAALGSANRKVDELLYSVSGIHGQASAVKGYVKSLYGFGSSEFKEISSLQFKKQA